MTHKVGGTPWALAITQPGHLVAGDMTTGNFVSADATHWLDTGFTDPQKSKMVMEYAVDPTDPTHVLMSSYGVVSSTDGGKTWGSSLDSKVMFGPVAWAATTPTVAYAVGFDSLALADERRREDLDESHLSRHARPDRATQTAGNRLVSSRAGK